MGVSFSRQSPAPLDQESPGSPSVAFGSSPGGATGRPNAPSVVTGLPIFSCLAVVGRSVPDWRCEPSLPDREQERPRLSPQPASAVAIRRNGRWFLRDAARGQTIAEKETRLAASGAGTSTEQAVASLSKALGDFSIEIANVIGEFVHPDSTQSTVGAGNRRSPTSAVSPRGPRP